VEVAATAARGVVGVGNNEDMVTGMMEEGDERLTITRRGRMASQKMLGRCRDDK